MKTTRRNHGAAFEAQVAVAALKGDKALTERAEHVGVLSTPITDWKPHVLAVSTDVFVGTMARPDEPDLENLHAPIGPLTREQDC